MACKSKKSNKKSRKTSGSARQGTSVPTKQEPSASLEGLVSSNPSVEQKKLEKSDHLEAKSKDSMEKVTHQMSALDIWEELDNMVDPHAQSVVKWLLQKCMSSKEEIDKLTNLSKVSAAKNLRIAAGEVLKWSLGKGVQNFENSSIFNDKTGSLTDRIEAGRKAFGFKKEQVREFKDFGNQCVTTRNDVVHFKTLEALDSAVAECAMALSFLEGLRKDEALKNQIRVIDNYEALKKELRQLKLELSPAQNENPIISPSQNPSKRPFNSTSHPCRSYSQAVAGTA